jgi:phage baseplate assembly protein W
MSGITPKLPLSFDNKHGYNLIKKYKNLATQNLKNLILTSPGERIMDPTFGVGLRSFLFQLDHDLTRAEIISRIEDQVKKYLPFIQIDQVIFNSSSEFADMDPNLLSITIEYIILPLQITDKLDITI